jgi:hypothetical protein
MIVVAVVLGTMNLRRSLRSLGIDPEEEQKSERAWTQKLKQQKAHAKFLKDLENAAEASRKLELDKIRVSQELDKIKEAEKQRESDKIKEAEKQRELDKIKEAEKQRELDKIKEAEQQRESDKIKEAEQQRDLDKIKEAEQQRELARELPEQDTDSSESNQDIIDRIEIQTSDDDQDRKHDPPVKNTRRKRKSRTLDDVEKPNLWVDDSDIPRFQSEEEFEIEKIVAHTGLNFLDHPKDVETRSYLIRWAGSDESGDSWEEAAQIEAHNFEIVDRYWDRSRTQQLWITGKGKNAQVIDVYEVSGHNQRFIKCIPNPGFKKPTRKRAGQKQLAPHCKAPRSMIETSSSTTSRVVQYPADSDDEPLFKKISSHQIKELREVLESLGAVRNRLHRILLRFV